MVDNLLPEQTGSARQGGTGMGRIIKLVLVLAVFGFLGLTGFAYLADLSPASQQVTKPVTLHAD